MKWFDNPRKRRGSTSRRRKSRRRPPKGYKSWKSWSRAMRSRIGKKKGGSMARRRGKRRGKRRSSSRRHSRRSSRRSIHVVRHPVLVNRRRHRGYRRRGNPRFSMRGVFSRATTAAVDGVWIVGGKAVTNALPALIGLSPTGILGLGIKALAAVASGYLFGFVSANAGKLAAASGFASIYEPYIKGLNLPILSPALAADDVYGYAAYPDETDTLPMSAYPGGGGGVTEDELAAYPQY